MNVVSQTLLTRKFRNKDKRFNRGELDKIEFIPVQTCENTFLLSYKYMMLHAFGCVRRLGYIRERGPAALKYSILTIM